MILFIFLKGNFLISLISSEFCARNMQHATNGLAILKLLLL